MPLLLWFRFAPIHIPATRRLQTFAVMFWTVFPAVCLFLFFFCLSKPVLWPILIPYLIWVFFIDDAPNSGGRPKDWIRKNKYFEFFGGYFPVSLIKEADLPADRNYVFGYHPHGIIGIGAVANFASDATGFSTAFPGLKPHLLTLSSNFYVPFFRDILMSVGICSVSYKSCKRILNSGKGSSLTIVVGGATESLSAHPGTADLTLRRRLGFIKLAIREGADLVPCFSFGENDIFAQLSNEKGSQLHTIQKNFQRIFGFTLPLFHGRGIFNYTVGLMPYRHPIITVIGRPVSVVQKAKPTIEDLRDVQGRYIEELMRIWEEYKNLYSKNRIRELNIVD
ncbi:diacylglycerol acyltransferase [Atractiella rhizophila]|nr:diacylglycerol acyltransferase [Atractiella rhizophila]